MEDFDTLAKTLKALSDPVRLRIIDMLSCMELCACSIQEGLSITQPTISHHMSILKHTNIITSRKKGTLIYYSINQEAFEDLQTALNRIRTQKEDCVCYRTVCSCQTGVNTKKAKPCSIPLKRKIRA